MELCYQLDQAVSLASAIRAGVLNVVNGSIAKPAEIIT
jgi:hypothetical protein